MGQVITIACHKGGVGKTTTAASIAGILSERGQKVLMIDMDAQKNLTETFSDGGFEDTVFEAFMRKKDLPVYQLRENLFLAPSSDKLSTIDIVLGADMDRDYILSDLIAPYKDKFDWVIVDSPAQLGITTANALVSCDKVIIPISCDAYSMGGLKQVSDLIMMAKKRHNPKMEILGILLTRFNKRRIADTLTGDKLREAYGELVFNTYIRENTALVQAPLCKKDIFAFDPKSNGAIDYSDFCDEMTGRLS